MRSLVVRSDTRSFARLDLFPFVGFQLPLFKVNLCLLQTYLTVCKDVVMVGLGDYKFQIQLLQWSLGIMQTGILHFLKDVFRAINNQTSPSLPHFAYQDSCFQVTDM